MLKPTQIEKILDRIQEWIKAADQKISVLLAFQGVVLTLIAPKLLAWFRFAVAHGRLTSFSLLLLGSLALLAGVVHILRALIPSLKHVLPSASITFFGDIAGMKLADFKNAIAGANDASLKDDLIAQAYVSASIASKKHVRFVSSIKWFFIGLVIVLLARIILELNPCVFQGRTY